MQIYDTVKAAAADADMTLADLGRSLGHSRQYVTSAITNGRTPSTTNAAAMLNACDWKLMAVPPAAVDIATEHGALPIDAASE